MKHLHKFASVLLALVMAFSLMAPAFAAPNDPTPGETENPPATQTTAKVEVPKMENHTFTAYQIFSGTQEANAADDAPLADIAWGSGINSDAFLAALKASDKFGTTNPFANADTAVAVAAALKDVADDSAMAIAFANIAADHTQGNGTVLQQGPGTTNTLPTGYYVIIDTTTSIETGDARNAALLQLTKDVTVSVKVDVPKVEKKVEENRNNQYGDAADYAIGDKVPYKFTSAVPDMAQYETYKYEFHDKMDAGLTFNNDVEVKIGGTTIDASAYQVVTTGLTDGCTFEVKFADLKTVQGATKGAEVEITFTATLNPNAVVGITGNANEVTLKYSNNPHQSGNGDPANGDTPPDKVLVFTYELDNNKVSGATPAQPLKDAEFHLSREVEDENGTKVTEWAIVNDAGKITDWVKAVDTEPTYVAANAAGNLNGVAYAGSPLKSGEDGLFKVLGLDNGNYSLLETKAPAGYNTPKEPFAVVISSTLVDGANPTYKDLSATVAGENATADNNAGKVTGTIVNQSGATLPETGGIGTTIFYVVGGLLTVGAVVLLVTKKRMSADSDK